MTEEIKGNEQTPEEIIEETQETLEEVQPGTDKSDVSDDIDYKAELEKERARRMKAEAVIQRNKDKDEPKEIIQEGMSQEEIDELVVQKVRAETEGLERRLTQSTLITLISEVATSPDEAELIKYHIENTVRPSGDLRADVGKAKLLANAGKFEAQLSELKRKVNSNANTSKGGGAGQKKETPEEPVLTEAEKRFRRNLGLTETPKK